MSARGEQKNQKTEKIRKKNNRKTEPWKKPIRILKKLTSSVRFWFYKPETEKTKSKRTQTKKNQAKPEKKPSQTEKIEPKPSQTKKTESNRKKPNRK